MKFIMRRGMSVKTIKQRRINDGTWLEDGMGVGSENAERVENLD
jgi:hypothetical protein